MDHGSYGVARQGDLQILRSSLSEDAWGHLSRLLEFSCTKPEWIILAFAGGVLVSALALIAPSEFGLPLEIIRLYGEQDSRTDALRLFQLAIERARMLGVRELYCTLPENSNDASVVSKARFFRWRKIVRFESTGPAELSERGYQSMEVSHFKRAEIVALIEKTSCGSFDSQIAYYRQRLGGIADAEVTLQMMEFSRYDVSWWRVALAPDGNALGIIFPVVAFGELTIGFLGVLPEFRGSKIASFLLQEAWSILRSQGYSRLWAEVDEQNVPMQRALKRSQFNRRSQEQEWKLELSAALPG